MNQREQAIQTWLQTACPTANLPVLLAGDASFRRYFRVRSETNNFVLMDAPPEKESCTAFVAIAKTLGALGLQVPEIHCADLKQGFLLLTDFGDCLLLDLLSANTANRYYHKAFDYLLTMQSCQQVEGHPLPFFDKVLFKKELGLFRDWYLGRHLGQTLNRKDQQYLDQIDTFLIEDALSQPQVFVHRDYHSRNLMVLHDGTFGILDFQDAVYGPITYDLMSLLRDCYVEWPFEQVKKWVFLYHQRLLKAGYLSEDNPEKFLRWCDWIALQRHLKCIGIFSRLHYRDHKSGYLNDIPRVVRYAKMICQRYVEFEGLEKFLVEGK